MNEELDSAVPDEAAASPMAGVPARLNEVLPDKLLLLPLRMRPFFPGQSTPIVLEDELWRATIERVGNTAHKLSGWSTHAMPSTRMRPRLRTSRPSVPSRACITPCVKAAASNSSPKA